MSVGSLYVCRLPIGCGRSSIRIRTVVPMVAKESGAHLLSWTVSQLICHSLFVSCACLIRSLSSSSTAGRFASVHAAKVFLTNSLRRRPFHQSLCSVRRWERGVLERRWPLVGHLQRCCRLCCSLWGSVGLAIWCLLCAEVGGRRRRGGGERRRRRGQPDVKAAYRADLGRKFKYSLRSRLRPGRRCNAMRCNRKTSANRPARPPSATTMRATVHRALFRERSFPLRDGRILFVLLDAALAKLRGTLDRRLPLQTPRREGQHEMTMRW